MPLDFAKISRRDFLVTAGAAAASLAIARDLESATPDDDAYGGFKMCIQSYSLRGFDLQTALKHSQQLGLQFWESFPGHIPLSTVPAHIRQHKALLDEAGVTLLSYGVLSFDGDEPKAREVFDFAKAFDMVSISANPKKSPVVFDQLDKLVEEYQIPIAIHNHGPGATYDKIDDVVEWTKDRHPLIGACVDTGHYLRSDENPVEAIERLGKRVFGVHLKDARSIRNEEELARLTAELPPGAADRLRKERKIMTILGEGELDVAGCLNALRQNEFDRSLSLEYEENPDNPLSDIEVCLKTVRDAVKSL
ncbi:MAG: sugar phosphate isomerase/epimerase [Planctomycetaceae bacterium]|nr:sugar phosphate isomerase/epimerase [Planctomycetaceae bacterium]